MLYPMFPRRTTTRKSVSIAAIFGLIRKDERWSAVFASKIGGESRIGRHSGGDDRELQQVLTQSGKSRRRAASRFSVGPWSGRP
jgi:hypothetical protein